MNDRVPTTEDVRNAYASMIQIARGQGAPHLDAIYGEFDQWLAEHDRVLSEKRWDEGYKAGVPAGSYFATNPYGRHE